MKLDPCHRLSTYGILHYGAHHDDGLLDTNPRRPKLGYSLCGTALYYSFINLEMRYEIIFSRQHSKGTACF